MISIIVPVYNSEKYLEAAVNSVLKQTFQNWELVLVNDGSTDNSLAVCKKFAEQDRRIKVFSQENKGQAAARNLGLNNINTPYVTFLDADDEIALNTLTANISVLQKNTEIDCVQYPTFVAYKSIKQYIRKGNAALIEEDFYKEWLEKEKISWTVWDKIFKTSLFDDIRFKEGIVYEDNLMVLHLMDRIKKLYISDTGLYYYYARENSTTTAILTLKKEQDSFYVTNEILKTVIIKDLKKIAIEFLLRVINIKKSLFYNFEKKVRIEKGILAYFSYVDIMKSDLKIKDKAKLIQAKLYAN